VNTVSHLLGILRDVGFPKPKDFPTKSPKGLTLMSVSPNIVRDLRNPVFSIDPVSQPFAQRGPIPAMPEVAIAKDGYLSLTEH
jgi:hypothetical protein